MVDNRRDNGGRERLDLGAKLFKLERSSRDGHPLLAYFVSLFIYCCCFFYNNAQIAEMWTHEFSRPGKQGTGMIWRIEMQQWAAYIRGYKNWEECCWMGETFVKRSSVFASKEDVLGMGFEKRNFYAIRNWLLTMDNSGFVAWLCSAVLLRKM